jgi:hypothetical protein
LPVGRQGNDAIAQVGPIRNAALTRGFRCDDIKETLAVNGAIQHLTYQIEELGAAIGTRRISASAC